MKLTFAANHGEMGGGEVMLLAMAEIARDLGHDVTIVAPSAPRDMVGRSQQLGFRVIEIHAESAAAYLRALRRWDAEEREGILWCNGLRPAFATTGHADRVVHLHQVPAGKLRLVAKAAVRGVRAVVVPSQYMASAVECDAEVLDNWSPGVTAEPSSPRHDDVPRIGFIGRLSMDKGIGDLAEALHRLQRDRVPFRLVLAGVTRFVDDAAKRQVETALAPLEPVIDRLGWVKPSEFFEQVDLVVVPSAWDEPFGLVVTEAMSARKPLVVTSSGAMPEIVGRDYPWIARKGNPADLARVIRVALAQPAPGLLEENHQRWADRYSPEAGRQRFAAFLDRLERQQA